MFRIDYPFKKEILACGAPRQASFCLTKKNCAYVVSDLGNLDDSGAFTNYKQQIENAKQELKIKPKVVRNVLKESTAQIMTEMMIKSVESGEAHYQIPKGFKIAGKTGTAQIPVAGHYDSEKTIASFVGFAPAHNPKFVMLVTLTEPKVSPWGSETAAPLFMEIASELFLYYKLSPGQ